MQHFLKNKTKQANKQKKKILNSADKNFFFYDALDHVVFLYFSTTC